MWRFKRQILIFVFAAAILILGGFLIFPRSAPSCFDGKQNGDETGIDCGGSCPLACAAEVKPLFVRFSRAFSAAPGVYNLVAYVENTNPHVAVFNLAYEFRTYDSQDVLIAERQGRTFIPPNNRFVVFETDVRSTRQPVRTTFRFLEEPVWFQVNPALSNIAVLINEEKFSPGPLPRLSAMLLNQSIYVLRNLVVTAVIYDASGNALAASKTLVPELARQTPTLISFSWNEPLPGEATRFEIIPQIDVFNLRP